MVGGALVGAIAASVGDSVVDLTFALFTADVIMLISTMIAILLKSHSRELETAQRNQTIAAQSLRSWRVVRTVKHLHALAEQEHEVES